MDIQDIKNKLTISEVIKHYGLKADKQNRLKCPFHEDKTPSLQLYYKTPLPRESFRVVKIKIKNSIKLQSFGL